MGYIDADDLIDQIKTVYKGQMLLNNACPVDFEKLVVYAPKVDFNLELYHKLATDYLNLCDRNCRGDMSVGIQPCPFWQDPDVGAFGEPLPSGCELSEYEKDIIY